ncbi:GNAT family N-acetyltransferase [Metarhizobium album]|uniref:GNAT family N-acetyltransferase n=1 Tax=Metarhizobium album TaxID=2182425 RepID=A0A2U2DS46_9HYPH|nr:GNAT family N-acetyltransferase [Rhizobium album]PWE56145.1 GNAT family N-acetyltransferase [Rhizobium album]
MDKPLATQDLIFRQDYFDDPAGWRAISDLLRDVFGVDISPLDRLGGHDRSNMPSAWFDADGRCVANFSAFAMPLMIEGRRVEAAGLQSGAVRPDYRGRGLFRELTRITLQRCEEAGYEAIVLYTDKPGLYLPYGFVTVPQFRFSGPAPAAADMDATARRLDIRQPADLAVIRTALASRTPVSNRFAVTDQSLMFLLNAYLVEDVRLSFMDDFSAVVAWRTAEDGRFELLDIAAPAIPPLAAILAALGQRPASVTAHVPPDRLAWQATAEKDEGGLVFMMRCAPDLIPAEPFCLSPMAEF